MKQFISLIFMFTISLTSLAEKKLVIAHRGASGYLPEHSMPAKAMAYAMGSDYIEQDVVMTKDDHLVVLHDIYLDRVTNVADLYPERKRDDGRYYVIDFTLGEVRKLKMTEGFKITNGKREAIYPNRFPLDKSRFRVHTFTEEIELIQGLNKSMNRDVGICPELKAPWFHEKEGKDIAKATLLILKKYGYTSKAAKIYLQSADVEDLKRVKNKLFKELDMEVKLVQLMLKTEWKETMVMNDGKATPYDYDWMFQAGAMEKIAKFADAVGPWHKMIVSTDSAEKKIKITDLVKDAHNAGLKVFPYTFRADASEIPSYVENFDNWMKLFFFNAEVDGLFTDFPDKTVNFLKKHK